MDTAFFLVLQWLTPVFGSLIAGVTTAGLGAVFTNLTTNFLKERLAAKKQAEIIATTLITEVQSAESRIDKILDTTLTVDRVSSIDIASLKADLHKFIISEKHVPAIETLISGYHEQALSQARAQFYFSVAAATAGFFWILYSAADIRPDNLAGIVKSLPGVVMDAVAFLFFKQAAETRQRATDLYDRLRKDKQTSEAIALVSSIDNPYIRSAVKAQMALHMAGLAPSPINLMNFTPPSDLTENTSALPAQAAEPSGRE